MPGPVAPLARTPRSSWPSVCRSQPALPPRVSSPITMVASGVEMSMAGLVVSRALMRATVHWVIVSALLAMRTFSAVLRYTPMVSPVLASCTASDSVAWLGTPSC